jgi:predicted nuclease of restriction endonuclease-like (RecB) superfamily
MAKFADIYKDFEIWQTVSAKLSWSHNVALIDKIKDDNERLWYAKQTVENGWSLNVMHLQIESKLYECQAIADKTTNFKDRLPAPQSDLAQQILKDPYIFDFVEHRRGMVEREVEDELVNHIAKFLLELGKGFSFVGQQYHLEVENEDFYIDLLFYHLDLRCYVVVELKTGAFKPEYAGKLNFYISAVDSMLKKSIDNPTIGILLCREKKKLIAEYALRDIKKPMGVSEFKMTSTLPKKFKDILPTAEDIESRLQLPDIQDKPVKKQRKCSKK